MTFPDRLELPLKFDPVRLRNDLEALTGSPWYPHFVRQNYDGDWNVMALRGPAGASHPVRMIYSDPSVRDYENTPVLGSTPYFREVLGGLACPLHAVRLMQLMPGSVIKEHRDHDLAFECGMVRLHLPIVTNPDVDFRLNGMRVTMVPGSLWYLRLSDPHSVSNRGATTRIHLVIDAEVNDWLAALLQRATVNS